MVDGAKRTVSIPYTQYGPTHAQAIKITPISNPTTRLSISFFLFSPSLVTRTGYFLVCSCAARRSGLVFIEIAYSQLLLSLKSIRMEKWNRWFT